MTDPDKVYEQIEYARKLADIESKVDQLTEALNKLNVQLSETILSKQIVLVADDDELAIAVSRGVQNGIEINRSH